MPPIERKARRRIILNQCSERCPLQFRTRCEGPWDHRTMGPWILPMNRPSETPSTNRQAPEKHQNPISKRLLPRPARNPPSRRRYGAAGERGEGHPIFGFMVPMHAQSGLTLPMNLLIGPRSVPDRSTLGASGARRTFDRSPQLRMRCGRGPAAVLRSWSQCASNPDVVTPHEPAFGNPKNQAP